MNLFRIDFHMTMSVVLVYLSGSGNCTNIKETKPVNSFEKLSDLLNKWK